MGDSEQLAPGTRVTASIELRRLLGRGGMGSVWVAHHEGLDAEVAVKFITPTDPRTAEIATRRFEREARAAAKIGSPHVVHHYDHGLMQDGTPYIVMELLRGETLGERLERGPLARDTVAAIVTQMAKGLAAAHKLGVVHRDIKPDNIFLVEQDDDVPFVKILDFGIAKNPSLAEDNVTSTGALIGTPAYMSPEQLKSSKAVGPSTDLWALAVVAYEALTGTPPFAGDTLANLVLSITGVQYAPPSSRRELPPTVDAWFARALDPEASARFAGARELAAGFRLALAGETPQGADDAANAQADTGEFILERRLELGTEPGAKVDGQPIGGAPVEGGERARPTTTSGVDKPTLPSPGTGQAARWPWAAVALLIVGAGWLARDRLAPPAALRVAPGLPAVSVEPPVVGLARRSVPAGWAGDVWLPSFDLERLQDDGDRTFVAALAACRARSMWLCTADQHRRACELDSKLGAVESWLLDADRAGVWVHGAGAGCGKHDKKPGESTSPSRAGVCCSRAVGLVTSNRNASFLRAASAKLGAYEAAMSQHDMAMLGPLIDPDKVMMGTRAFTRAGFVSAAGSFLRRHPDHWVVHARCEASFIENGWRARCHTIALLDGKLAVLGHIFDRGGDAGLVQRFSEGTYLRPFAPP